MVPAAYLFLPADASAASLRLLRHARRQDHVLRDRGAGDGPDLGLHRHPVARARAVLRARRLRDGDVPDALDRPRRRLSQRSARLHGVPRLEGVSRGTGASPITSGTPRCSVVLVPGLLAFVFGFFAFRSRIKGVYFSIITQALTYAFMLLFFRNDTGFGGNNGFTDFKRILGYPIAAPGTRAWRSSWRAAPLLLASLLLCRFIVTSQLGRVLTAIRDAESRVMFFGYNPRVVQALRLDAVGGAVRDRRRALRAAGGHHQSRAKCRPRIRSRSRSGRPSAVAAR